MNKHILAALDGSLVSDAAADWAAARAEAFGANLILVHVTPPGWSFQTIEDHALATKRADDLLNSEMDRLAHSYPWLDVSSMVVSGEPAETLAGLTGTAGLLVAGTDRGPGTEGQGYGSVSFQIAVTSLCPVAIIPRHPVPQQHGVVVGVDGSRDSKSALELAAGEARRFGEALLIVHAVGSLNPSGNADDVVGDAVTWVHAHFPDVSVSVRVDPVHHAAEALAAASSEARLLVLGRKGRGGMRVLLGSVGQHTLLNAQCPTILTIPAEAAANGG